MTITATDVDAAIRHAINAAITYEAQQLSSIEQARLKLALGENMSEEVSNLVDSMMFSTSDSIADCVAILLELIAADPSDE